MKSEQISISEAYQRLGVAIVMEVVKDYRSALRAVKAGKEERTAEVLKLEKWLRSEWAYALSGGADGDFIIEEVRKECLTSRRI